MDERDSMAGLGEGRLADPAGGGSDSGFHAPDLDPRPPKDVHEAMDRLQGRPTERAWFFNEKGKPFYVDSGPGEGNVVRMTPPQVATQSRGKNAHNHLAETFFSEDDLRNSIVTDRAETWVVTPGGARFGLLLAEGHGISADDVAQAGRDAYLAAFALDADDPLRAEAFEFARILKKRFGTRASLKYTGGR